MSITTKTKWTPGPWDMAFKAGDHHAFILGAGSDHVAFIIDRGIIVTEAERERANALLIAASPELYSALETLTERFKRALVASGTDPEFADAAVAHEMAVLAKARGEA
jgi:hypothetical protein